MITRYARPIHLWMVNSRALTGSASRSENHAVSASEGSTTAKRSAHTVRMLLMSTIRACIVSLFRRSVADCELLGAHDCRGRRVCTRRRLSGPDDRPGHREPHARLHIRWDRGELDADVVRPPCRGGRHLNPANVASGLPVA